MPSLLSDARCRNCIVRGTLGHVSAADNRMQSVLLRSERHELPPRRALFEEDAPATEVFALRKGSLKILRRGPDGEPRLVRLMKAGAVAGLEALLEPRYRTSAVALEPLEFCRVPLSVLGHIERAGGAYYRELMRHWQANLDAADSFVAMLGTGTSEQRLARLLIALGATECPSLPRSDIGAALGVSMETASRLMADFRRRGVIRGTRGQLVCDAEALRALANRSA
jgi:CRP/FNR family transcriptional regulator, anaerobic regulatory protein